MPETKRQRFERENRELTRALRAQHARAHYGPRPPAAWSTSKVSDLRKGNTDARF